MYDTLEQMIAETAEGLRPDERLSVSQAATKYRKLNNPGSFVGDWNNDKTPYLVEPMNLLTSTALTSLIFVGPAQCGKTDMLMNWITHTAICSPADMMVIQMSQAAARDFAKRRIERLFRHSPDVGAKVKPGRQNQNTYDTRFLAGTLLTLSWPTITELSGKPVPRLWLTDYDRMPENVDGEGTPFDLSRARAKTFKRFAMTVVESSPGFEVENSKKMPKSPHEAPPTKGALALYNRGDRRRWYWRCPHCSTPFEPDFSLLIWPDSTDLLAQAEEATMSCPTCGADITHDEDAKTGNPGKYALNLAGRWVSDNMRLGDDGVLIGKPIRTDIASFWLKGVAAAFSDWKTLVFNYLNAEAEFESTGSQEALKTTVNVDQGLPYTPKGTDGDRLPEDIKAKAIKVGDEKVVVHGVRFLVATIDVQKHRFVVQVHGFGVGGDMWIVDRFDVKKSERLDEDDEHLWVTPGAYPEDWHLLVKEVIQKTYPLGDGSGRQMAIKAIGCDSGGREGVTSNAYEFWRWLRDRPEGGNLHRRLLLIKGASVKSAPRVQVIYPDSERKDRKAAARGEVPVLAINGNTIKDALSKRLDRSDPNGGKINFPSWLEDWFYSELVAETRTIKGWENLKKLRNEAWDLLTYAIAISLSRLVMVELIDWANPPGWAAEWDDNDLVFDPKNPGRIDNPEKVDYDLEELAKTLA